MRTVTRTQLARKTREVVSEVRRGHPTLVESYGEQQVVILDALDYRLLRGAADWAAERAGLPSTESPAASQVIIDYLSETISLGKAAEKLGVSRFELMERFERLRIPLRLGPSTVTEALSEVETARTAGPVVR